MLSEQPDGIHQSNKVCFKYELKYIDQIGCLTYLNMLRLLNRFHIKKIYENNYVQKKGLFYIFFIYKNL